MFDTICGWYHIYYLIVVSNLRLNDFLPIVQCARQEMMTSAKGLVYFKNLCYKSYKNYIQSCFVPSLLQIEQILNKLERTLQWLPQLNLFDLKKANFCRVPVLTNLKLSWIHHNYRIFKNVSIHCNISFA